MFTQKDIQQIESKGSSVQHIELQIHNFKRGFPFAELQRPAIKGDGIIVFSERRINELVRYFEANRSNYQIIKFVPASGAASRMFKNLFTFLEEVDKNDQRALLLADKSFNSVHSFIERLKYFAFFPELVSKMAQDGIELNDCLNNGDYYTIIDYVVNEKGLDYGNLPKGLLNFHSYGEKSRKSLEEHLVEAAVYGSSEDGISRVHFTV